jgi:hypothetical protein
MRIAAYYESRKQKIHDKLSPQRHRSQARREKVRTSFTRRNRQHRDIARIAPLPGGTYLISLKNGQEISSSRFQSRCCATSCSKSDSLGNKLFNPNRFLIANLKTGMFFRLIVHFTNSRRALQKNAISFDSQTIETDSVFL